MELIDGVIIYHGSEERVRTFKFLDQSQVTLPICLPPTKRYGYLAWTRTKITCSRGKGPTIRRRGIGTQIRETAIDIMTQLFDIFNYVLRLLADLWEPNY